MRGDMIDEFKQMKVLHKGDIIEVLELSDQENTPNNSLT